MRRFRFSTFLVLATLLGGCLDTEPTSPVLLPDADVSVEQLEANAARTVNDVQRFHAQVDDLAKQPGVVHVPAGSVDALADAIADAGNHGVVVLEPGLHQESGTVIIDRTVKLLGLPGAVLEVDTHPLASDTDPMDAALHVQGVAGVRILGIALRPAGAIGGTGILVDHSPRTTIAYCTLDDHQYSITAEQGDGLAVVGNTIHCSTAWLSGTIPESHGVIIVNAEHATIANNTVTGGLFGLWPCDKHGVATGNDVSACFIGIILCRVPMAVVMPNGDLVGAEFSATRWVTKFNHVSDCFDANYIVIDGANNNLLAHNESVNPGTYDIELVGDSYRFGFLTPSCFENKIIVGDDALTVKDCGIDNHVIGGTWIDIGSDPCF